MPKIKRALISVSDKRGLVPFCKGLNALGVEIISTGGTARLLKQNKIPVIQMHHFTGMPEILAGRVKTLHPQVHGGILANRQDNKQMAQARKLGLKLIDLVVVNLYPFEATVAKGAERAAFMLALLNGGYRSKILDVYMPACPRLERSRTKNALPIPLWPKGSVRIHLSRSGLSRLTR